MIIKKINMATVVNRNTAFTDTPWEKATSEEEAQIMSVFNTLKQ